MILFLFYVSDYANESKIQLKVSNICMLLCLEEIFVFINSYV